MYLELPFKRVKGDTVIATCSGEWRNGKQNGKGKRIIYYIKPGKNKKKRLMEILRGHWKKDKLTSVIKSEIKY